MRMEGSQELAIESEDVDLITKGSHDLIRLVRGEAKSSHIRVAADYCRISVVPSLE